MFKSPGHIAFSFYSIDIHYYGIIMSFSILFALFIILLIRKKFFKDISVDSIFDISLLLIISGIIGARIYYVLFDYKYFLNHPTEIFAIWNGGISIHGAILGGVIVFYIYARKKHYDFLKYADLFVTGTIFAQAIGRWGNFFNSEAFGLPCSLPWKLYIPYPLRPVEYRSFEYFHPAFLYESILNFIIFLVLLLILYKYPERKNGILFFTYILLYSFVRICTETIRIDSVFNVSIFHIAHIISIILILFSCIGIYLTLKKKTS